MNPEYDAVTSPTSIFIRVSNVCESCKSQNILKHFGTS